MAVYKIFPEHSATLYSYYPTLNSGLDEILEISTYESIQSTYQVSRALLQFPSSEIADILSTKIGTASFKAYLKSFVATTSEIPTNFSLYCYPLAESWNPGTGRFGNSPITTDGVSWQYRVSSGSSAWSTMGFATGITASYNTTAGGGVWYTGSNGFLLESTQSFTRATSKDISIDVTNAVRLWNSGSISNNGFIVKNSKQNEFNSAYTYELKYFSGNTHTIYPPSLEMRWDDSVYSPGFLSVITSNQVVVSIPNNKNEYNQNSIQLFRVNVRDQFPTRVFQTTSLYLNNKVLPSSSYWSIKDLDTEEIIIDFDTEYTKISSDSTGNYFEVYMDGLEPERYYKILIKTVFNNNTIIFDNNYYFKVVR